MLAAMSTRPLMPFGLKTRSSSPVFFTASSTKSSSAGGGAAPTRENPMIAAATARAPNRPIDQRMIFLFVVVGSWIGRAHRADPLGVERLMNLEILGQSFPRLGLISTQERQDEVVRNRRYAAG